MKIAKEIAGYKTTLSVVTIYSPLFFKEKLYYCLFIPVCIHHNRLLMDTKQTVHLTEPAMHFRLRRSFAN